MRKRNIIISSILFALTLGLGINAFHFNNQKITNIKAGEEEQEEEEKRPYVYIDCSATNTEHKLLNRMSAQFWVTEGWPYCGEPGIAMTETIKKDVWRIEVPENCLYVAFYSLRGDGTVYAEQHDDAYTMTFDNKMMFKVTYMEAGPDLFDPNQFYGKWVTNPDIPEEEGYYLTSSNDDYKYASSIKMNEGTAGDLAELLQYQGKKNEYIKVRSFFDSVDTSYPSSGKGYQFNKDKVVNVYINENKEFLVEDYVIPPIEDGYYVFGTYDGVSIKEFADAYHASTFIDESRNYIAVYDYITCQNGDVFSVKAYSSTSHPRQIDIAPNKGVDTFYFDVIGNTVKLKQETYGKHMDIYIVDDDGVITFYPEFHSTKCFNQITAVFYTYTNVKLGTQELPDQISYSNTWFDPDVPDINGYHYDGELFVNEDCTEPYERRLVSTPKHIYIKYYQASYYMLPTDGSLTLMETENIEEDSLAEITVHATYQVTDFGFVYFDEDGKENGFWLGEDSDYAYDDIVQSGYQGLIFTSFGDINYFRVYIKNDKKIYIKEAGGFFSDSFYNTISNMYDESGNITDLAALKEEWNNQKADYEANVEYKGEIIKTGFQYFENPENIFQQMMNLYYSTIYTYGSAEFENFLFPDYPEVEPHLNPGPDPETSEETSSEEESSYSEEMSSEEESSYSEEESSEELSSSEESSEPISSSEEESSDEEISSEELSS